MFGMFGMFGVFGVFGMFGCFLDASRCVERRVSEERRVREERRERGPSSLATRIYLCAGTIDGVGKHLVLEARVVGHHGRGEVVRHALASLEHLFLKCWVWNFFVLF